MLIIRESDSLIPPPMFFVGRINPKRDKMKLNSQALRVSLAVYSSLFIVHSLMNYYEP